MIRILVVCALLPMQLGSGGRHSVTPSHESAKVDAHIHEVETGLMRAAAIAGAGEDHLNLQDRMRYYHVPGVSIAVIHNGQLEWARGYGETKLGGPRVTPETLFAAASISKPLSAMVALTLVQSGKLNLDRDVSQYLRSWKLPESPLLSQHNITIRELLNHTSGLDRHGVGMYMSTGAVPTMLQELDGVPPAKTNPLHVVSVPGSQFSYSGGGYEVLQQLLTDVTGEPFEDLARKTVLEPAGMIHSTFNQHFSAAQAKQIAMPYAADGAAVPGGYPIFAGVAAGGLWTTPIDLVRLAVEVQKELAGQSHLVLSSAMAKEMLRPGLGGWGLGFQVGGSTRPWFAHEGADVGYNCYMVAYNSGDGVVIMTNGMGQIEYEILRSVARAYGWPDFKPVTRKMTVVSSSSYDRYVGTYGFLNVTREGDKLMLEIPGGVRKTELLPESATRFFVLDNPIEIEFLEGPDKQRAEKAIFDSGMVRITLQRK